MSETQIDRTVVAAQPIIELDHVSKTFGANSVYEDMSLAVYPGETLTIIGGSGQGKSVCLKMMIGLLGADEGHVRVAGHDVGELDDEGLRQVRRRVAYVFQGGALFDSMNVLDNIGYALREHTKMGDEELRQRALECLQLVNLQEDMLAQMPASLSGGQRKRVALARSIAIEPEVILYDEPTTGLDPRNITRIGDMIMKLQKELRVTSVVVTHDMPTAHKVSDRIAMLYEKKFPYVGTTQQMWHSEHREVRDFIHGTLRRHGQAVRAPVPAGMTEIAGEPHHGA
ncbi:MAG TPA: ATP-binding cassette domain-containing protein [Nannocystaceae bacterium]|nr:ATP-binding cassette domain-containing protein [Nannocystaceae bacterium]